MQAYTTVGVEYDFSILKTSLITKIELKSTFSLTYFSSKQNSKG